MSQQYKDILNSQLPADLYKGNDIESRAIGKTLDRTQKETDDLELEVNPLTARYKNLEKWEKFFKLPSNSEESIKVRRAKLVTELIQFMGDENVIKKDEMESITGLYADDSKVIEHFSDYIFDVDLKLIGEDDGVIDLDEAYRVIDKIKPSWTGYRLGVEFKPKLNKVYIGSVMTSGEEITVYPWNVSEIVSRGKIELGIVTGDREEITVYPKGE